MNAPLDSALDLLEPTLGSWCGPAHLARIDESRDGIPLVQVSTVGAERWFALAHGRLVELDPRTDELLPAAGRLDGRERLLSWRPGRRITWKCEAGPEPRLMKGYRRRRSRPAVAALRLARRAAAGSELRVPGLVDDDPDAELVTSEFLEGRALDLGPSSAATFFRIGHGLRVFQESGAGFPLARHDRRRELRVLDGGAARTLRLAGGLPGGWRSLRAKLDENVREAPAAPAVLVHRDLHDRQLLSCQGGVGLIDFDLLCLGDHALDAANLSAHLSLRALQGQANATESTANLAAEALLDGLDRCEEQGFAQSLRFYQTATFLRLAALYHLRPRWRQVVPDLVALAGRCCRDLSPR